LSHAHAQARRLILPALVAALALALALSMPALAGAGGKGHHGKHRAQVHSHHQGKHGKRHGHRHHGKRHGHGDRGHHGHGHHGKGKGKVVNTMTRNLYLGANLLPAIGAETPEQLGAANGQILREVVANEFPTRAEGLAEEILEQEPDLVGLQEVALWQTTPLSPEAAAIEYDYLAELMAELNAGKGKTQYEVVVVQEEFDLEAPGDYNGVKGDGPLPGFPNSELLGRLTMRDVILARNGAGVQTWNEGGGNFDALQEIDILGEKLFIKRGWTQTDAKVRGSKPFRFVNTHLEAFNPLIRLEQAEELVDGSGPATTELPVVLVGDLNSDDDTVEFPDTLAYEFLLGAGMVSLSTDEPLSCCLDSSLLEVKAAEEAGAGIADFDHQVDHIMTRDPETVTLQSSTVTGLTPVNGFWNSDHAGVFSALRFGN
jgi:endonuclease/exonuclease/phosphatase family metal-dependent hydrolase